MAEHETHKEKYLYVLGTEHAVRFLNGGRAMSSVLSRNEALRKKFTEKFGDRYRTVRDYYLPRKESVVIELARRPIGTRKSGLQSRWLGHPSMSHEMKLRTIFGL